MNHILSFHKNLFLKALSYKYDQMGYHKLFTLKQCFLSTRCITYAGTLLQLWLLATKIIYISKGHISCFWSVYNQSIWFYISFHDVLVIFTNQRESVNFWMCSTFFQNRGCCGYLLKLSYFSSSMDPVISITNFNTTEVADKRTNHTN